MKKGILKFNRVINRYSIVFDDGEYFELHCDDKFFCSPELNDWTSVRIEYDNDWYIIDSDDNKIPIWKNMLVKK